MVPSPVRSVGTNIDAKSIKMAMKEEAMNLASAFAPRSLASAIA